MLTTAEVAQLLGVSSHTITRLINTGKLPAINVSTGRRASYRVEPADVEAFKEQRAVRVAPKPRRRRRRKLDIPRYV